VPRYLFVTGKLAAQSLQDTAARLPDEFEYEITVLPITVAALMDTRFVAKHLESAGDCDVIMIPGLCKGDLSIISDKFGLQTLRGPKTLKDLPAFFGQENRLDGYGEHHAKILAEIVDAYQISLDEISARAHYYKDHGADIIDLGCPVEGNFPQVKAAVSMLKQQGFAVSLDTFNQEDTLLANQAGLDYLLSVNSKNIDLAPRLSCKVVVIPDFGQGLESLVSNIARLQDWKVPYIIDPILEPISFGFSESLHRYYEVRRRYPQDEIMMGLGNLTELTDADTTGVTAVMAGIITELQIDYVLTTEVISWARGAVRELDLARNLMYYAWKNKVLPKHLDDGLLTIKDPPFEPYTEEELRLIQAKVRDRNFRIFTDLNYIYVFNNRLFIKESDIQAIFPQLEVADPSHAFYLGRELYKASLALQLGKKYIQEQPLRWGYLNREAQDSPAEP
jgi:dihydropteroate synthase-like protein